MAIEKVINIKTNVKDAVKDVKDLYSGLMAVENEQEKINKGAEENTSVLKRLAGGISNFFKDVKKVYQDSEKQLEENEKAVKKQSTAMTALTKVSGGVKSGFNAVGGALKGIGIGLIVALVAKLTDAFKGNQKVTDALNIAFTAISNILSGVVEVFVDMFEKVSEATGGFDALRKVIGGALSIAINTVVIAIQAIALRIKQAQLAWEESFLGDKDPEEIKRLTGEIGELEGKIADTAEKIKQGGKDIANNFVEAVGEIGSLVQGVAEATGDALEKIDVKQAISNAKLIERNKKNFELLALQQARLQLLYQTQAEQQRQFRDDVNLDLETRRKASDELGKILKKQFTAEGNTIKQRIAGLQTEQKLLGFTTDRQNEIYQLQTDLIDVAERLKGQESEQLTSKNSLLKEQLDLLNSISESENQRAVNSLAFEAQQIRVESDRLNNNIKRNELEQSFARTADEKIKLAEELNLLILEQDQLEQARLEKEAEKLALERELAVEELERKRSEYMAGTQARADAEQEYLDRKQEFDQREIELEQQKQNELTRIDNEENEKRLIFQQSVEDAKKQLTENGFNFLTNIAKKGSKLAKGLAIANVVREQVEGISKIISNTAVANAKAAALSPQTGGMPFVAINTVSAGLGIAGSIAGAVKAIKDINSESKSAGGGSAPSSGGGGGSEIAPPAFNLIQGTDSNQIAESVAGQNRPLQAFVVSSSVTSQQELDRNIETNATWG